MISVRELRFAYPRGHFSLRVPRLEIARGEAVALVGPSGCGKTTLLWLIAGILRPLAGSVTVDGMHLHSAGERARRHFRASRIGLILQDIELIEYLSVLDNIMLPLRLRPGGRPAAESRRAAAALAADVGLSGDLERYPHQLSHGEQQRVGVCRGLITGPPLLLADEPTSSLDPLTARQTVDRLFSLTRQRGMTLLMLTHDHGLLDRFDRVIDASGFAADTAA